MEMKKVVLASVTLLAAGQAMATAYCNGATTSTTKAVAVGTFIKTAFNAQCSANSYTEGLDGGTFYRAGGASAKGKNGFAGSTLGGGVTAVTAATCVASGCTATNASTAASAAQSS